MIAAATSALEPPARKTGTSPARLGEQVARLLAGVWRSDPPALCDTDLELEGVAQLLLEGGAAPLAWWRLRHSELAREAAAEPLHDAYRLYGVLAGHRQEQLARAIHDLRALRAEPVLAKGWAMARQYPRPGLRPYGDFDMAIDPASFESPVREWPNERYAVDLNPHFPELEDRPWKEVFDRSTPAMAGDAMVRILGQEDHLRLLCFHFLRHGGWRPLWLSDIALLIEQLPNTFDWLYCLRGNHREAQWIASVIGLAQELLGVDVQPGIPCALPPAWLRLAVLTAWGTPAARFRTRPPLRVRLVRSWPDPLLASIRWSRAFTAAPRAPVQLWDWLARTLTFAPRRLARAAIGHDPFRAAHWTWR